MDKKVMCKDCVYGYTQSMFAEMECTLKNRLVDDHDSCENSVKKTHDKYKILQERFEHGKS